MSCEVSCDYANSLLAQLERAESEAAALRAEVERLKTRVARYNVVADQLAAARALLRDALPASYVAKEDWLERRKAVLSGQPTVSPRPTAAERALLDAMARVPQIVLESANSMFGHLTPSLEDLKGPVRAELARRGK